MKVYFACSITGGRAVESVYQAMVAALVSDGHQVPTAHERGLVFAGQNQARGRRRQFIVQMKCIYGM